MTIEFEPLTEALGARVHGLDLRDELAPATIETLVDAWHRYACRLHSGCLFDDQQRYELLRRFNSPAAVRSGITRRSSPGTSRSMGS